MGLEDLLVVALSLVQLTTDGQRGISSVVYLMAMDGCPLDTNQIGKQEPARYPDIHVPCLAFLQNVHLWPLLSCIISARIQVSS